MTPADTGTASNVFAGMLLCSHHCKVLQGVAVPVPYRTYLEARKLLECAT